MKLAMSLAFMLILNVFIFWSQVAVEDIAADNGITSTKYFNYSGSIISKYDSGDYTINENVTNALPTAESSTLTQDSTNFFTDTFASIKNWLLDATGLNYLWAFATAFPNMLKISGLPAEIVFGLGAFWYGLAIFLIAMMLRGYGS